MQLSSGLSVGAGGNFVFFFLKFYIPDAKKSGFCMTRKILEKKPKNSEN